MARQIVLHPSQTHRRDHVTSAKNGEDGAKLEFTRLAVGGQKHGVAKGHEQGASDNEARSMLETIGQNSAQDHHATGENINGDGSDLGLLSLPAELLDNRGEEEDARKTRDTDAHIDKGTEPDLVVLPDQTPRKLIESIHAASVANVEIHAAAQQFLFLGVKVLGLLRPVDDNKERDDGEESGDTTLNDEDPAPGGVAVCATKLSNGKGEKASKGASHHSAAEEERHALLVLVALVVHGSDVDYARQNTGFEDAEEESETDKGFVSLDEAHAHVHDSPHEHERGKVERGADLLDEHVGGNLQENVGNIVHLGSIFGQRCP